MIGFRNEFFFHKNKYTKSIIFHQEGYIFFQKLALLSYEKAKKFEISPFRKFFFSKMSRHVSVDTCMLITVTFVDGRINPSKLSKNSRRISFLL